MADYSLRSKDYGAIYLCLAQGCGDVAGRTPVLYCKEHRTAESRKKLTEDNAEVVKYWEEKNRKENEKCEEIQPKKG